MDVIVDLRDRLPAIRDQLERPMCLAFAVSTSHSKTRGFDNNLSADYLFTDAGSPNRSGGLKIKNVFLSLFEKGQPYEELVPVDFTADETQPCGIYFKARGEFIVFSEQNILTLLNSGLAPVLTLHLTKAFHFLPQTNKITEHDGVTVGKHAVFLAGYGTESKEKFVLIGNSWGEKWGNRGFAWASLDYLKKCKPCLYRLYEAGDYEIN